MYSLIYNLIFFQSPELSNESLWRFDTCSREEAVNLLQGKSDGTFLIRTAQNGGYALSIA